MITFGLTGGIAVGKSTVTKTLLKHNIPMVDADQLARDVVQVGTIGYEMLYHYFGPKYFNNYKLDRVKLGNFVFKNSEALRFLNSTVGVLIEDAAGMKFRDLFNEGNSIAGYNAALICERGNTYKYRPLIVVVCHEDIQLARLMSRNSLTREEAMDRINSQMSSAEKIKLADYVIDTSGTIEESIKQTEDIIKKISPKGLVL